MENLTQLSPKQLKALSLEQLQVILNHTQQTYESDLVYMKYFVKSIKIKLDFNKRPTTEITYGWDDKKKFTKLLIQYHKKTFYITFTPTNIDGTHFIRNMRLFDETELPYNHPEKLICEPNTPTFCDKIYCMSPIEDQFSSGRWIFNETDNVKLLDPDLLKAYNHFKVNGFFNTPQ